MAFNQNQALALRTSHRYLDVGCHSILECNCYIKNVELLIMIQNVLIATLVLCTFFILMHSRTSLAVESIPETPVVVELFTSQGCSSCPPADRIFSTLAEKDNVIALGFHVSYWNHLNWKDTFSNEFCDMRQHGYISLRGEKRVYTPQMIVNGTDQFVGSRANQVKAALNKAAKNPIQLINITVSDKNAIRFTLPNLKTDTYRLWAFGYKNEVQQEIGRGENGGKKVSYAAPVISYTNLGSWNGAKAVHSFKKPSEDIDGIAILAQRNGYGEILAAGKHAF